MHLTCCAATHCRQHPFHWLCLRWANVGFLHRLTVVHWRTAYSNALMQLFNGLLASRLFQYLDCGCWFGHFSTLWVSKASDINCTQLRTCQFISSSPPKLGELSCPVGTGVPKRGAFGCLAACHKWGDRAYFDVFCKDLMWRWVQDLPSWVGWTSPCPCWGMPRRPNASWEGDQQQLRCLPKWHRCMPCGQDSNGAPWQTWQLYKAFGKPHWTLLPFFLQVQKGLNLFTCFPSFFPSFFSNSFDAPSTTSIPEARTHGPRPGFESILALPHQGWGKPCEICGFNCFVSCYVMLFQPFRAWMTVGMLPSK